MKYFQTFCEISSFVEGFVKRRMAENSNNEFDNFEIYRFIENKCNDFGFGNCHSLRF